MDNHAANQTPFNEQSFMPPNRRMSSFSKKQYAYGAKKAKAVLEVIEFNNEPLQEKDVYTDILYCGMCHSDLHKIDDDWEGSKYPLVPGLCFSCCAFCLHACVDACIVVYEIAPAELVCECLILTAAPICCDARYAGHEVIGRVAAVGDKG
jgi:threonine dehydrogenase-like Zn-dependent dehydrogenase